MKQISPPFAPGDRVMYGKNFCLVLKCQSDMFGWDVKLLPEDDGEPFWIGSQQLLLARKEA